ncbi:MAG TPA: hypothetical protein VFK85_12210 [Anaeromyxobacteraceae bacterium]|nr:hypothetical protein [Anaeromyxobacteraceae bacterium]
MRLVLAALFAAYVALVAAMPHGHAHGVTHDRHECIACSTAGGEVAEPALPDLEPRALPLRSLVPEPSSVPASGAPLGAVPGQSPPAV